MKHLHTTKKQMIHFVDSIASYMLEYHEVALPEKHVVDNIMNYSKSLEVLKKKDGKAFLLVGN